MDYNDDRLNNYSPNNIILACNIACTNHLDHENLTALKSALDSSNNDFEFIKKEFSELVRIMYDGKDDISYKAMEGILNAWHGLLMKENNK